MHLLLMFLLNLPFYEHKKRPSYIQVQQAQGQILEQILFKELTFSTIVSFNFVIFLNSA